MRKNRYFAHFQYEIQLAWEWLFWSQSISPKAVYLIDIWGFIEELKINICLCLPVSFRFTFQNSIFVKKITLHMYYFCVLNLNVAVNYFESKWIINLNTIFVIIQRWSEKIEKITKIEDFWKSFKNIQFHTIWCF